MRRKNPFKENKYEIFYNLINSLLAGLLILLGSFVGGEISHEAIVISFVASLVVFLTKFKEYWDGEKGHFASHAFNFIKI